MSKSFRILGLSALLSLITLATVTGAAAQEYKDITGLYEGVFGQDTKPIEMSQVPQSIRHAAGAAVGDIQATNAGVEIATDGTVLYVLDFKTKKGRKVSVDISSDGKIVSVEHALTMKELPREVSATMKRWAPTLDASEIEKSVRPDGVMYEFVGQDSQGNEFYAEIPAHGRGLVIVFHHPIIVTPTPGLPGPR